MKKYYSVHPKHLKEMDTTKIRENFLVENIIQENKITLNYSFEDRTIIGGVYCNNCTLQLEDFEELGVNYFLERRELGLITLSGSGVVIIDGIEYPMTKGDGLYIPMGKEKVEFKSDTSFKLYLNSAPAHQQYEICHIEFAKATPVKLGDTSTMNKRTIYQYIHPSNCKSCQLLMGMTVLEDGSSWNTFPPHLHERRMESYFYFDMDKETRIFEIFGTPNETRHLVLENEQAFISPSYSIHSGVGTGKYTFIWAMAGENQNFDDMDHVNINKIK